MLQQGSSNTYKIEQEAIGKQITVKVSAEGYIGTVNNTSDTVAKADGVLTLKQTEFTKTFGDEAFELGCSRTGDGTISYKVSDSKKADGTAADDDNSVIKVSDTGVVTIVGAGSATITVSLSETECYTGAAEQTITVTVNQASAPTLASENISYVNTKGSGGAVTIDIADKLPENRGDTTYTVTNTTDSSGILQNVAVDTTGKLTYTVISGKQVGDKASITVTAQMANYESATFTVNISITDKIVVALQNGSSVTINGSNALTYGDKLSKLNLGNAVFVEAGTNTVVHGTLEFAAPDDVPTVGTTTAGWKFTPDEADTYAELTGTVEISVSRATPNVTIPTVSETNIVYDPAKTLKDYTLNGTDGTWIVGGTETSVAGSWSWKTDTTVPIVNNRGYVAVFTPADSDNYSPVEKTVTVTVAKATPVITENPTASAITYKEALKDSTLSGGKVNTTGSFAWVTPDTNPTVADSGKTMYEVVFTPSDSANWNTATTTVTLTVNKAQEPPKMPGTTMNPAHSKNKVGDVELPQGWAWADSDKEKTLEDGKAVTATANYVGSDAGNYENESVVITLTRSKCDHLKTELKNAKPATCKETGYTGDTYCVECGELVVSGTVIPLGKHQGGKATCIHQAVCTVCGTSYGDLDSSNHEHTEVRGKVAEGCTTEGYTGDTYCSDCKVKIRTGSVIAAKGHSYTSTVTKEATTNEEGVRTYTCKNCGHNYTESIPKLPEEKHTHSYKETVTKQPTCTENGTKTYTCSCGDSYTESIPAIGHNYVSRVTKEPTKSQEGVMTYICKNCGHSYTTAIEKLKDDKKPGDNKPGNNKPGDNKPGEGGDKKPTETPDTGKPFIKDETGKEGWDVIKTETSGAKDGDVVKVDMNGATVVPGDVLDTIAGKDVTIVFDMGNGITWSVNGKSITTDKVSDIDFSVKVGEEAGNTIPVDVINNVTGERYSIQISLAYDGEFGFTAVLSINMEAKNAGLYANLFYYNETTGELEFICADEIAEDGTADLTFTHASDYTIVIDEAPMDGSKADDSTETSGEESSADSTETGSGDVVTKEDAWNPFWIIIIGIIVIVAGLGVFFVVKKKEQE